MQLFEIVFNQRETELQFYRIYTVLGSFIKPFVFTVNSASLSFDFLQPTNSTPEPIKNLAWNAFPFQQTNANEPLKID